LEAQFLHQPDDPLRTRRGQMINRDHVPPSFGCLDALNSAAAVLVPERELWVQPTARR
jgi:hypothetical protein